MKIKGFLIVGANGSMRVTKKRPSLDWDDIAIALDLEIPDQIFRKPHLSAEITIPDEAAMPSVIDATVSENVRDAIQQATGLEFAVRIAAPHTAVHENGPRAARSTEERMQSGSCATVPSPAGKQ